MSLRIGWIDKILHKLSSLPVIEQWRFEDANEVKNVVNSHATEIEALQITPPGTGDMRKEFYDPADIDEQLVGLIATQSLTNKTVNGVVLDSAGLQSESLRGDGTYVSVSTFGSASSVDIIAKVNEVGGVTAGQVVYISGAIGGFPQVSIATNDDFSKADVLAIATETKTDGQSIIITTTGLVENIDTSAFAEGVQLYLGANGALTDTHPLGILAVQRVGHIVKVNASTGSMIVEREPLTEIDNEDLTLRFNLVNQNAGANATSSFTTINDLNHRGSLSITSSGYTAVADLVEALVLYNEGYGDTVYTVDGNKDHVWATDVTDVHTFAASEKMRLTAAGELLTQQQDIIHTATTSDDHALEIDCNVEGFGDVKAVDIVFNTGAIGVGDDEAVILVNIDESASTGGHVTALEVLATEGNATLTGMLAGVGVDPIEQFSGVFADMDSALSNAVNVLTEFTTAGNDLQIFVNDNDTVTIGNSVKFEELEFLLAINSSQTIQPVFEYSTGVGTWAAFSPVDGTNGMRNSGVIAWADGDIPGWLVGTGSEFLIRITRTRNNVTTPPTESEVQIAVAVEYFWDKDGDIVTKGVSEKADNSGNYTGLSLVNKTYADGKRPNIAFATKTADYTPSGEIDNTYIDVDSATDKTITFDTGAFAKDGDVVFFQRIGAGRILFSSGTASITAGTELSLVSGSIGSIQAVIRKSASVYILTGTTE